MADDVRVGQQVMVRKTAGSRIDGMVATVQLVGTSPHGWQWALAVVDGVGTASLLIPEDIDPTWRPDIPRQAVADLHAAVTKRMEQLGGYIHAEAFARRELSEVAESLRLLLEVPDAE